jgi:hypothetical protein
VPPRTGVGQIDRDLGVLNPSRGAGVLALDPDGAHALLQVPGLVDHEDRVGVAEAGGDVVTQVIPDSVGVPAGAPEEVLHAMRVGVTGVFGDAPAVLAGQLSEQPEQEPAGPAAGLDPGEPGGYPAEQPVGLCSPAAGLYAVTHGHRLII